MLGFVVLRCRFQNKSWNLSAQFYFEKPILAYKSHQKILQILCWLLKSEMFLWKVMTSSFSIIQKKNQTHLYGTDSGDAGEQCDCCVDVQHFQFTEAEGCWAGVKSWADVGQTNSLAPLRSSNTDSRFDARVWSCMHAWTSPNGSSAAFTRAAWERRFHTHKKEQIHLKGNGHVPPLLLTNQYKMSNISPWFH